MKKYNYLGKIFDAYEAVVRDFDHGNLGKTASTARCRRVLRKLVRDAIEKDYEYRTCNPANSYIKECASITAKKMIP